MLNPSFRPPGPSALLSVMKKPQKNLSISAPLSVLLVITPFECVQGKKILNNFNRKQNYLQILFNSFFSQLQVKRAIARQKLSKKFSVFAKNVFFSEYVAFNDLNLWISSIY
uniref:Uncharacterized protein n=1 Tax=Cacopsylla melanoneura TaxID=428564 RepID=A0A8D9BGE0_9HEMI